MQLKVLRACERAGRHNCAAQFEYLTTGKSMAEIMRRHYIASETTMYHMIREFYQIVEI